MNYYEVYYRYFRSAFPRLRPSQHEILGYLQHSDYPTLVVMSAPPGVGKSLIALVDAVAEAGFQGHIENPRVHIVTISKGLQDQYYDTIRRVVNYNPQWTVTVFKGRQNYECLLKKGKTAETCPILNLPVLGSTYCKYKPPRVSDPEEATKYPDFVFTAQGNYIVPPKAEDWCPYWRVKFDALKSNFVVFNYHNFFYELFLVGDFHAPDVVVLDEVHRMFDVMDSVFSIDVTSRYLKSLGVKIPPTVTKYNYVEILTRTIKARISELVYQISGFMESKDEWDPEERSIFSKLMYAYSTLYDIYSRLQVYLRMYSLYFSSFKSYTDGFRVIMKPLPVFASYILSVLFYNGVKRVVAMSATPGTKRYWEKLVRGAQKFVRDLGGPSTLNYIYIEYPKSPFPVERRLVYIPRDAPYVSEKALRRELHHYYDVLGKGTPELLSPEVALRSNIVSRQAYLIKSLYDIFGRVLVHTWNNKLAELMLVVLDYLGIPAIHPTVRPTEAIQEWAESNEETVLLTAAAKEGVDLYYDRGHVQVILKHPIPNLRDPYIKYLRQRDREFYEYSMAANIVQQAGRITRAADDWGFTIIFDRTTYEDIMKNMAYYPAYFRSALVTSLTTDQVLQDISRRALKYAD